MKCLHCRQENFAWARRCDHCGAAIPQSVLAPAPYARTTAAPDRRKVKVLADTLVDATINYRWLGGGLHRQGGEGNSRDILPLQGADVIAWVANRHRSHGDRQDWYQALFQRDPRGFKHYDYDAPMAEYEHNDRRVISGDQATLQGSADLLFRSAQPFRPREVVGRLCRRRRRGHVVGV